MAGKSLDEVLAAAEKILRMWEANPSFALGDLTQAAYRAKVGELRTRRAELEEARRQVTNKTNEVSGTADELSALTTRALSGVRAVFGPDSTQYEEAGGTRASEVRRARKSSKKGGADPGASS